MALKRSFHKKLLKIVVACLVIISCWQAITRHFEEVRRQKSQDDLVAPAFPGSYGYHLGIPDEYRKAFDNCHRFLELRRGPADQYIVNDQKMEHLVVTDLQPKLYESVSLCKALEGEAAEKWESWMEILPKLKSDGVYWSFCFPVRRVLYLYEDPEYENTGDYAQVIINKENNKVVGYIFPEYLNDKHN